MMRVRKPTDAEIRQANDWDTWTKEASKFDWSYDEKETCYILEGLAGVDDGQGHSIEFGPGDWVEFEQGLKCTWTISKAIRKKYRFG